MLDELGADLTAYLTSQLGSGKLARFQSIIHGDQKVRTELLPAITVDWDDEMDFQPDSGGIRISLTFAVTVYSSSLEGLRAADRTHEQLLIERHAGTFRGLIPALLRIGRGYKQSNGQAWRISFRPLKRATSQDSRRYFNAQTIEVVFMSLFNQSQFM